MLPATGVTFVAVMPTYRRQGVLSSLMRRQLAAVRDRGEPLAILWASEAVIYGRYDYGRASWHLDFTLRRGAGGSASTVRPQRRVVAEGDLRPGRGSARRQPAALPARRGRQRAARLRPLRRRRYLDRFPAGERADGPRADGGRSRRQRRALHRPAQPGPDHRIPPAASSGRRPAALPAGRPAAD